MSEPSGPVPPRIPQRIGDAERDQAAEYLRDHLAAGRIDQTEFDERLNTALTAKTAAELEPLFSDLPGPRPGTSVAPVAAPAAAPGPYPSSPYPSSTAPAPVDDSGAVARRRIATITGVMAAIAWPAAIIFCFATSWSYWWVMMIPMFFPWWIGRFHSEEHRQRYRQRDEERRRRWDQRYDGR